MLEYIEQINMTGVTLAGVLILAILIISSLAIGVLKRLKPQQDWSELSLRVKSWWVMAAVFFAAVVVSRKLSLVLFGLMSFWALKEYVTIMGTRRADHKALFFAFLTIPIQYYWVWTNWYGMFIVFIPVYVFLFLPVILMLARETAGFLSSCSRIQWGLMAFVFGLSHMGYLLALPTTGNQGYTGQSLLLFLVLVTEMNDVMQYIWGKTLGKRKILPRVSPKKTWAGFIGGVLTTSVGGILLRFLTPFAVGEAMLFALVLAIAGFCGDVVMSAVKRDLAVKDFGDIIPGHGGMLDRVDSLCYTAPIFFHMVYYFYF